MLILGAAGLLRGRRATSHSLVCDTVPAAARGDAGGRPGVEDGPDLITTAGVSAGPDLGLALARRFMGAGYAAKLELLAELPSAPEPDENLAAGALEEMFAPLLARAEAAADAARRPWGPPEAPALLQPEAVRA